MESRHDVCVILDDRLIDMLELMEDKVQSQLNVENALKSGSIHLAKSRYIMGQNAISTLQLPTENTSDYMAMAKVEKNDVNEETIKYEQYSLVDPEDTVSNPIKLFGVLVPQNLHQAQNIFKKCVEYIVESVNIDKKLNIIIEEITKLKLLKLTLSPEE